MTSACVPIATQAVIFRERYPDGLRDTLACNHVVYSTSTEEVEERLCLFCLRSRAPRRHKRSEGRLSVDPEGGDMKVKVVS